MRWLLAALVLASACRNSHDTFGLDGGSGSTLPDAPSLIDASDGIGCTPMTPRLVPPETFVGPGGLSDRLTTLIDSAQHSLELQMYLFDDPRLQQHISAAFARGVHVRVIFDANESGNASVRETLVGQGIELRSAPAVFTYSHAKYLIIDDTVGVIMSMNFNSDAMEAERNYGFVDRDPDDVADLQRIFTSDWAVAGAETPVPANLACTRLIVSPDNSRTRVLELLEGTQHTLDIEALYVVDDGLVTLITQAAANGVAVRVILESPSEQEGNDATAAQFAAAGIPVNYATDAQFYLHAKLIIADGVSLVGSENYSATSLTHNREVGALLFEPDAVELTQQQFDEDWLITVPATPSP